MIQQVKQREAELRGIDQGIIIGEARGEARGRQGGARDRTIDMAKRMLEDSFPVDVITRISGLTVAEVEALR